MKKLSKPQLALLVPLASLVLAWAFMAAGMYASLFERDNTQYDEMGNPLFDAKQVYNVHWSAYLFLAAVAAISLGGLWGQRTSLRARVALGEVHGLARAVHRFNNLIIWIGLGLGVIFVFGNFMSAFSSYGGRSAALITRIAGVYVPIVLATALVVVVILRAFVFRADVLPTHEQDEVTKAAERSRRRNLGLGYAVPIMTTAFAIVLGLLIYDATGTALQTWVWVLIQAIVIGGIVAGTRFANRAKLGEAEVVKPRAVFASLAAGAANLNLVLSMAFAAVVSGIAIGSTGSAIDKLYNYGVYDQYGKTTTQPKVMGPTWQWFIEDLAPAKVLMLLVVIGTYLTITLRNKETGNKGAVGSAE